MAEFVVCQVEPCTKRSPCTQPFSRIPACIGCRGDGTRLVPVADARTSAAMWDADDVDFIFGGPESESTHLVWIETTPSDRF